MNRDNIFPTVQDLTNEWNWGWITDASQLNIYVQYGYLTAEQYKQITGQSYVNPQQPTNGTK